MLKGDIDKAKRASEKLTEKYLSHGYVIDRRLAKEDIGLNIIEASATVWENMWNLHCYYNLMFQENPKLGSIIQSRNFEFTIGTNLS